MSDQMGYSIGVMIGNLIFLIIFVSFFKIKDWREKKKFQEWLKARGENES